MTFKPTAQLPAPPWPGGNAPPPTAYALLSPQLQLFVDLYRETGDAMASAVRAKMFSPDYPIDVLAAKTLEREDVRAAIVALDLAQQEAAEKAAAPAPRVPVEITKDVIMADLQNVFEVAMGHDGDADPMLDANGKPLGPKRNLGAAIAAKKVQASMIGALKQTIDVNFHAKRAEDMTDEELDRIIKGSARRQVEGEFKDITPEDEG